VSGASLAEPDAGLICYAEMVHEGASICRAAALGGLPVVGDGDTGYGNALNVKRTVRGYAAAGFAGILIEDQVGAGGWRGLVAQRLGGQVRRQGFE
jgi:2-methylisocitrate lyase-like PEP mutase family enzyme